MPLLPSLSQYRTKTLLGMLFCACVEQDYGLCLFVMPRLARGWRGGVVATTCILGEYSSF